MFAETFAAWLEKQLRGKSGDTYPPDQVGWYINAHDIRMEEIVRQHMAREYPDLPRGSDPFLIHQQRLRMQRSDPGIQRIVANQLYKKLDSDEKALFASISERKPMVFPWARLDDIWTSADLMQPVGSKGWRIVRILPSSKNRSAALTQTAAFYGAVVAAGAAHVEVEFWHIDPGIPLHQPVEYKKKPGARSVHARLEEIRRFQNQYCSTTADESVYSAETNSDELCLPDTHTRFLMRGKLDRKELLMRGIEDIRSIPDTEPMSKRQRNQRNALLHEHPLPDPVSLNKWLQAVEKPIVFLDFEAIQSAKPMYPKTFPWQYVPIMYSITDVHGSVEWVCLPVDSDDLTGFADGLAERLAGVKSIGVFGEAMEKRCLALLSETASTEQGRQLLSEAVDRIVDLHLPFEAGWVYFSGQRGKTSLKALSRVLFAGSQQTTEDSREPKEIADGREASLHYYWQRYGYPDGTWPTRCEQNRIMGLIEQYSCNDTLHLCRLWEILIAL